MNKKFNEIKIKIDIEKKAVIGIEAPDVMDTFEVMEILNITQLNLVKALKANVNKDPIKSNGKKIIVPENKFVSPN